MPTREFLQQKVSLLFCTYICHFLLGSRKVFLLESWQLDIEWVYSYNSYCIPLIKYKPLWITCALDQSESTFQVWEAPRGFDKLLREFSQTVKYWVYTSYKNLFISYIFLDVMSLFLAFDSSAKCRNWWT